MLRTFRSRDGSTWTAWHTQPQRPMPGTPCEWLTFQNAEGTERMRLLDVPLHWEELSDERLDLLRRVAVPVRSWETHSPPGGIEQIEDHSPTEQ